MANRIEARTAPKKGKQTLYHCRVWPLSAVGTTTYQPTQYMGSLDRQRKLLAIKTHE
jgi:hypothetical protein